MKPILLSFVFFVFCSAVLCTSSSSHKSQHVHHAHAKSKIVATTESGQEKWVAPAAKAKKSDENGSCRLVCDGNVDVPKGTNVTKYADGSWSYELQVEPNFFIHVGFNHTTNFMAIFNPRLNLTWVTDGILIGVFNMTSDVLFLIDTSRNIASIFTNITVDLLNVNINGALDLMVIFQAQFGVMLDNSLKMVANFAFKVDGFLKAMKDRTIGTFFQGHFGLENIFNVNFGFYMNGSMKYDGFSTFLQPIVGFGQFSMEIVANINGGIEYGTKLTIGSVGFIFTGLGRITLEINNSLHVLVTNSVDTFFNITTGSIKGFLNLGGFLGNVFTGSVHVSGGGNINISTGSNNKNGFLINYGNATGMFSINYNSSLNTLGFFNSILKFVMVADGNTGVYMIFNVTSGVGLVVNSTGFATLLPQHSEVITGSANLDLGSRFAIIAELLKANENIDASSDLSFDFKAYLSAYFKGDVFFEAESELSTSLEESFGELFAEGKENNAAEIFAQFGISVMFNIVYGDDVISINFAKFMNSLYVENNGQFSMKIMKKVYDSVQKNIKAGKRGFSSYIFNGILKACLGGGINLNGIVLGVGGC